MLGNSISGCQSEVLAALSTSTNPLKSISVAAGVAAIAAASVRGISDKDKTGSLSCANDRSNFGAIGSNENDSTRDAWKSSGKATNSFDAGAPSKEPEVPKALGSGTGQ